MAFLQGFFREKDMMCGLYHGNQFSDFRELYTLHRVFSLEYFCVTTLPLYKNTADAKLASRFATRDLAKHWCFCKGSLRNISGLKTLCSVDTVSKILKIDFRVFIWKNVDI